MSNIAFSQVYMHLYMINIAPEGDPKNWALIGEGITNPSPEPNEVIDQTAYVSGRGMASSDVTGGQLVFKFDGHRVIGDPAQDYIASLLLSYGDNRKTDFKWIAPNGQVIEGPVTIVNIVPGGGDANSKDKFSFEVHYDGMPTFTAGDSTAFPESITAKPVTVKIGQTAAVEATAAPSNASASFVYGIDDSAIATVDADGNVRGIKAGKTSVCVKSAVFPMVSAVADVTVSAAS